MVETTLSTGYRDLEKMLANFLSFIRIPLAFLLIVQCPMARFGAIFLAMLSDIADGFVARRFTQVSKFGTLLDPIADKVFVSVALTIFFLEKKISVGEIGAFLCRDIALVLFSLVIALQGRFKGYKIQAFYCGKIVTTVQFVCLMTLSVGYEAHPLLYICMASIGLLSFVELYRRLLQNSQISIYTQHDSKIG